jgi:uncharacterized membrane protein (UPF0136 family)
MSYFDSSFLAGVATTVVAIISIMIIKLASSLFNGETYGVSHYLLTLESTNLWLNMGLWMNSVFILHLTCRTLPTRKPVKVSVIY